MKRTISSVLAGVPLVLTTALVGAEAPVLQHEPLTCVPEHQQAKIEGHFKSTSPIVSARVYFRSDAFEKDYFFEMRQGDGDFFYSALPFPELAKTKKVHYRIDVKNREGGEATTPRYVIPVDKACRAVVMTPEETGYAENLIVGKTDITQTTIPSGWRCQHLISYITPDGVLIPAEDCRPMAPLLKAALIGTAAAIPIIIISTSGGGGGEPVSRARPAGSSGQ